MRRLFGATRVPRPLLPRPVLPRMARRWLRDDTGRVIGIDLGTTNSCVAYMDGDKPVVVEVEEGRRTLPSIVAHDLKKRVHLVGAAAQRQMVVNSRNTFYATKRLIGRRHDEPEMRTVAKAVSYAMVAGPNGDAWVADEAGKAYSPSQIASEILMRLKKAAEGALGEKVSRAVITVPAYFDAAQRQATQDAGAIAGLKVERIINEPTAAALAYGVSRSEERTVAVYDLGGGTFDVSILQMGDGVFEVRSTSGDTLLGGEDFNDVIVSHLIERFQKDTGTNLRNDKVALQRVREASERAKHELSSLKSTRINLPYIATADGQPLTLDYELTRAQFEKLSAALIERTLGPCRTALRDAGLAVRDITDVVLVGGMTRMPRVRELVRDFFGQEAFMGVNPDEAVAIGAAIQGSILASRGGGGLMTTSSTSELVLLDVTPLNLGVALYDGSMAVIIPAQTPIPCTRKQVLTTVKDYQTTLLNEVYQGNRPLAKANRLLGQYTITGIPSAPAGVPQLEVTFECTANGIIKASTRDMASGAVAQIKVAMSGGLSQDQIETMRLEAERAAAADEARLEAERLLERVEKASAALGEADLHEVRSKEQALRAALDSGANFGAAVSALESALNTATTNSYNRSAK